MKSLRLWTILAGLVISSSLYANLDTQDFGSELIFEVEADREGGPFRIECDFDIIGTSRFRDPSRPGEHIAYSEAELEARCIYYYDEETREGADLGLIYETSNICWKNNPYFEQESFHNVTLSFGAFSQRWKAWFLHLEANINVNADHVSFFEYTNFDLLLISRYSYCKHIGVYTGFIAQTGMKMDRIYPVLGVDWEINDRWVLNAIFPINMSLIYNYNCNLSFALAARTFDTRQRLGRSAELSRGLLHYTNSGLELAINWDNTWVNANLHAGYTFGGRIRTSDQHNKHSHRHRFNSAGYGGGELSFHF